MEIVQGDPNSDHKALLFYATNGKGEERSVRRGGEGKWKTNDKGDPEHWTGMRRRCDERMRRLLGKWTREDDEQVGVEEKRSELIEKRWQELKEASTECLQEK